MAGLDHNRGVFLDDTADPVAQQEVAKLVQ